MKKVKSANIAINFILAASILVASCTMAPKYKTPESKIEFVKSEKNLSKLAWQNFFESDDLKRVIKIALENNRDLKVANLNIESARAIHGIARSDLLPTISANASEIRQGTTGAFAAFTPKRIYRANIGFTTYEIDFFGRLQSLKKSALEDFLATNEARNLVEITLISEVANSYAQLVLDREILEIKKEKLLALEEKNTLINKRFNYGLSSKSDSLDSIVELENSKIEVATYEKLVTQDQNALMYLMGDFDEKNLPISKPLSEIKIAENALDFIPSKSLLSRPDVKQAEHNLKSDNANIGAARAAFFPSISLTGNYGYQSREATDLFNQKNWTFTPQINIPIFSGGRATANLRNAKILKEISIMKYQQTIEDAFRESLDKLADRRALIKQKNSSDKIFDAKWHSHNIAKNKQKLGLINKLDRVTYHLDFLAAKQEKLALQKEYLTNLIELYKTLGGGSEIEEKNK